MATGFELRASWSPADPAAVRARGTRRAVGQAGAA